MLDVVLDMETHDPDDFLTLLLLLGHPEVNLKAVTITPGSRHQVGLVRRALGWFDVDIPVGARNIDHPKPCVSSWHIRAYGSIEPSDDAGVAGEVLLANCDEQTTLVTGAPLCNLGAAMNLPKFRVGRWVAQGGFAGEGVIPPERQLPKFRRLVTCPTYNMNGDPRSAIRALEYSGIGTRYFVSKNVCHGVFYDEEFHDVVAVFAEKSRSLKLIWKGMDVFLRRKRVKLRAKQPARRVNEEIDADPVRLIGERGEEFGAVSLAEAVATARKAGLALVEVARGTSPPVCRIMQTPSAPKEPTAEMAGKKLHDPLAACCAIDRDIAMWAEVQLYRSKGEWGSRLCPGSNTWIIVDYDREKFVSVFTAH